MQYLRASDIGITIYNLYCISIHYIYTDHLPYLNHRTTHYILFKYFLIYKNIQYLFRFVEFSLHFIDPCMSALCFSTYTYTLRDDGNDTIRGGYVRVCVISIVSRGSVLI